MRTWEQLSDDQRGRCWDRFYADFEFRPSFYPANWPGIREPTPSVTYSIRHAYDENLQLFRKDFDEQLHIALRESTYPNDWLYFLDWQHLCYRFRPHADEMERSAIPDGDYAIFLTEDFRFGTFGHPWEKTICVFGEPLLRNLLRLKPRQLTERVRVNGKPI